MSQFPLLAKVGGALAKQYVSSVAAGMHHVAALCGPRNSVTGRVQEGAENSAVFTWGRSLIIFI